MGRGGERTQTVAPSPGHVHAPDIPFRVPPLPPAPPAAAPGTRGVAAAQSKVESRKSSLHLQPSSPHHLPPYAADGPVV